MKRIAVDVVLLPDPTLDSVAVAANRDLLAVGDGDIRLGVGRGEGRPHLSLAMGVIDEDHLATLTAELARLAAELPLDNLHATRVEHADVDNGRMLSMLQFERTPGLHRLHKRVMKTLEPALEPAVTGISLYLEGEKPDPKSLEWIASFEASSAFDRFTPHITLGYGLIELPELPRRFPPGTLAVCHLGNGCTCRRVLVSLA